MCGRYNVHKIHVINNYEAMKCVSGSGYYAAGVQ